MVDLYHFFAVQRADGKLLAMAAANVGQWAELGDATDEFKTFRDAEKAAKEHAGAFVVGVEQTDSHYEIQPFYHRFIALWRSDPVFGKFGIGETAADAIAKLKRAGGRWSKAAAKRGQTALWHFSSMFPFCPATEKRDATAEEADAYVTGDGRLAWIRCNREEIGATS